MSALEPLSPEEFVAVARAGYMNALPFVRWDRCVRIDDQAQVYGWIERADGHADFVLLVFEGAVLAMFTTSSARWSRAISRELFGDSEDHIDCERVTDVFGDLVVTTATTTASGSASALGDAG